MPAKKSAAKKYALHHKDGSLWAKGQTVKSVATSYWEWFRKDGSKLRSGYFDNGEQSGECATYDKHGKVYKVTLMKPKTAPAKKHIAAAKSKPGRPFSAR